MPTQYKLEVFDRNIDFKPDTERTIGGPKINFDYLTLERSKLTVPKISAARGDFVHITDMAGHTVYQGIIDDYAIDKATCDIAVVPLLSLLDIKVEYDRDALAAATLEDWLSGIISDTYITNDDELQNIPMAIETTSATAGTLDLESNIGGLYSIVTTMLSAYGIVVTMVLDPQEKEIRVTIGRATSAGITIEADLPNVIEKKFVIGDSFGALNKLTIINQDDENERVTYYLHTDGTVSTSDVERIWPVFASSEYISGSDFATAAAAKAADTLAVKQYDNLIELTMLKTDSLIDVSSMTVGAGVSVTSGDNTYNSIITGYALDGQKVTLIFGIVRVELTKKLTLAKRESSSKTYASASQGAKADAALPSSGGVVDGDLDIQGMLSVLGAEVWNADNLDVEVGTWTATIYGETTAGTPTYSTRQGIYGISGRLCVALFKIELSNKGGMAGRLAVSGLPRAVSSVLSMNLDLSISAFNFTVTGSVGAAGRLYSGDTRIALQAVQSSSGTIGRPNLDASYASNSFAVMGRMVYPID